MEKTWIDIFTGGQQTDSTGQTHDGDKLIDSALSKFSSDHTPPVVAGHPKDNAPAYGWVNSLRSVTKHGKRFLQAKLKQVNPAFQKAVEAGSYKKRSASFYPDGSLRHLGFLGAAPPAIKGLEDIKFAEQGISFDFAEPKTEKKEAIMEIKEFFEGLKFWKESGGMSGVAPDTTLDGQQFSEADIEKIKVEAAEEAATEARKKVKIEFAEKEAVRKKGERVKTITNYLADKVKDKEFPPSWIDQGLGQFMEQLADAREEIEFSEGVKKNPGEWFVDFLEALTVNKKMFSDFATKADAGQKEADAEDKLGKEIAERA